ncbi:MAG: metallophosphoesterase [Solirubrobacteraceae bacterium]
MRLYVLSDLHLERERFTPVPVDADVVVLAGDIAVGTDGVQWAREWADGRPVLYVVGNHEFYGHAVDELINDMRKASSGSSVRVLENDELIIDGVRFLGCTLWSDFEFDGPDQRTKSMLLAERAVNDYGQIESGSGGCPLTPDDTRQLHLVSRGWLTQRLADSHPGPTVVVTHHAPLIRSRPSSPVLRALVGAFASDVTDLMSGDRVALWIFGHTHRVADLELHGTRVISNPRGYPHQPVAGFDPACVIEVSGTGIAHFPKS